MRICAEQKQLDELRKMKNKMDASKSEQSQQSANPFKKAQEDKSEISDKSFEKFN